MSCVKQLNFGFCCENPELLLTSQWQKRVEPSVRYLVYRWIFATYFSFVLVLSLFTANGCKQLSFYAIYLTNWNVILNAVASLYGAFLVTLYYRRVIKFEDEISETPKNLKVYWLLSILSLVLAVSLSCVYWPLIYTGRDRGVNDALTHAGNAIVLTIDNFIVAHPPRYGLFVYPLGLGLLYAFLFSLPYTLLGGLDRDLQNYIYSVLDWTKNFKGALTFAIATIVFLVFMHFVLTFLAVMRVNFHKRLQLRKISVQSPQSNQTDYNADNPSFSP